MDGDLVSAAPQILMAEEDPNDAFLLQRALRRGGLPAAAHVSNGEEAVDYLSARGNYSHRTLRRLMLLDLKLPRLSGMEVLRWLRGGPGLKFLPVVMLTSSALRSDIESAYAPYTNSYLVKPVHMDALEEMIRSLGTHRLEFNRSPET
ncbi:MAG: response regulator [Akkermansiaceae bacterium]|nr:response regulator [Armatimonadota bacterium]